MGPVIGSPCFRCPPIIKAPLPIKPNLEGGEATITEKDSSVKPIQSFDLQGRVAVVTGGSRGLGREMVLAFAHQGADVVIASRKLEACQALAEEVENETGRRALAVSFHAGRWNDCDTLAEQAYSHFGRVDILVNNAGMSPLFGKVEELTEALYDKVLSVNLKGPFQLASLIGSRMANEEGGSIINISSTAAIDPSPAEAPYAAAKAGINNMTVSLARALGPAVRVNCIMPGPFGTDISKAWSPEMVKMVERRAPLGRIGRPNEIVGAALYLASEASSFTSGAIIKIDGGIGA